MSAATEKVAELSIAPKDGEAPAGRPPIPAYFLSLTVENVRCFGPKQTLDLSDGEGRPARWTVLLGDNGVGKTTLLQGLLALAAPESFGAIQEFRRTRAEDMRIGAVLGHGASLSDREGWSTSSCPGITERVSGDHAYTAFVSLAEAKTPRPLCFGYGAARRMGVTFLSRAEQGEPSQTLFTEKGTLQNAEEWLLRADYLSMKKGQNGAKGSRRLQEILGVLVDLLPDVESVRISFPGESKAPRRGKLRLPRVMFKTPYGLVTLDQLSLGYRTMVAWMVDLASRMFEAYPGSRDPLAEPAVALVDEIDLHLHPKWQRSLMQFLTERFKNTQFIVTAHSPLVVQAAEGANVAVLRREGDHAVISQDLPSIRGWRVGQILTSDLFGLPSERPPQMEPLLTERERILTKGTLSADDKRRVAQIERELGDLPTGESPREIEAMDVILRAAARLKKTRGGRV